MSRRYIDADALIKDIENCSYETWSKDINRAWWAQAVMVKDNIKQCIKRQPTADVVEVRHGEWRTVDSDLGYVEMECSLCGHKHLFYTNQGYPYCPNCGAKMDGERREENEG